MKKSTYTCEIFTDGQIRPVVRDSIANHPREPLKFPLIPLIALFAGPTRGGNLTAEFLLLLKESDINAENTATLQNHKLPAV